MGDQSLTMNPPVGLQVDEVLALAGLARQCAENGSLDSAQELLEGLIAIDSGHAYLHTCLGCVYMRLGRSQDALGSFDRALAIDPRDVAARTYAGELRLERNEPAAAMAHLEAAIALDPEGKDAYANRARTLKQVAEDAASTPPSVSARG